jgi:GT2 family glycosyltransferase
MFNNNKIGVGIITCERPKFFEKSVNSIPNVDCIVVVNDGKPYNNDIYPNDVEIIQHDFNMSVGISKNHALKYLMDQECDHIFLMEDDIEITNENICDEYIKTAEISGIWHLNYGLHGNYNRSKEGKPVRRHVVDYGDIKLSLYQNILGAWSYYYKGIIKNCGFLDQKYHNAWEHVDHTYTIIKKGLHPPFWYFADIHQSENFISDIKENFSGSKIRSDQNSWQNNMAIGASIYKEKWGFMPTETPDLGLTNALDSIEFIKNNYARKIRL